ncbi:hypothetical protein PGTUg99_016971 [Puccinia graminis f. sp. tritici]|uniref:Mitochondrial glycine transporter n=1 Tax=Puccinia graminis f. sp. tritici TaxID=56615 RepID=A0A5B0MDF7_PUCGR|nr:hypothetical protein PGTUg99_016971 [Puccinia graminis f. sp. tritici]
MSKGTMYYLCKICQVCSHPRGAYSPFQKKKKDCRTSCCYIVLKIQRRSLCICRKLEHINNHFQSPSYWNRSYYLNSTTTILLMADRPTNNSKLSLPPISLHLLSGALSGLASCVLLQPFDLLKTRLQQAHISSNPSSSSTRPSIYRLSSDVISRDGILGLWRGTSPTIIRNVPGIAAYFFGLAQLRTSMSSISIFTQQSQPLHLLHQPNILPTLTPTGDFFAGVLARISVGFVLMPVTVVKTRFESNLYEYRSIRAAFQEIMRTQGLQGLWRGFIPTALRDAPFAGVFISAYEATKRLLVEPGQRYPILLHTVPATAAAVVATLLTAPFDLLKTDLQLRQSSSHNPSILQALKLILNGRLSNSRILFKGSGLRLLRKSLSSAIGWTLYEGLIKKWAIKN